jgi:hypothetical protein
MAKIEESSYHDIDPSVCDFFLVLRGPSLTPGVNFVPWGWSYPMGVKFYVHPSILLHSRECSPQGVNEGVNIPLKAQISPLGARG